jgi:hypothetical protein
VGSNRKAQSLLPLSYLNTVPAVRTPDAFYNDEYRLKQSITADLQALHIAPRDESPPPPAIIKSRSSSPVLAPQNEPAVKNEILLDAMPVAPQVAGTILHAHLAASISVSVPESQQSTPRSTPMPPVASVPTEPASQQQTLTPPASTDQDGLTTEEVIVMIAGYRGHDRGLTQDISDMNLDTIRFLST